MTTVVLGLAVTGVIVLWVFLLAWTFKRDEEDDDTF